MSSRHVSALNPNPNPNPALRLEAQVSSLTNERDNLETEVKKRAAHQPKESLTLIRTLTLTLTLIGGIEAHKTESGGCSGACTRV